MLKDKFKLYVGVLATCGFVITATIAACVAILALVYLTHNASFGRDYLYVVLFAGVVAWLSGLIAVKEYVHESIAMVGGVVYGVLAFSLVIMSAVETEPTLATVTFPAVIALLHSSTFFDLLRMAVQSE